MPTCTLYQTFTHPFLTATQSAAMALGGRVLWVGGLVRDVLAGLPLPQDLDVMVLDMPARALAEHLAVSLNGTLVTLDEGYGIYRVVVGEVSIDCAQGQDNDLHADLARRDLTVNAIAYDPESQQFIDPFGGRRDLAAGHIRMISEANLLDDPLRMVRVFRFAASLAAALNKPVSVDPATLAVVQTHGSQLLQAAPERIRYEFLRLLDAIPCFAALQAMAKTGLLEVILPELTPCRAIPPNSHHHLWLLDHTLQLVDELETLLPTLPEPTQTHVSAPFGRSVSRLGLNKMACLLHDIGKPETMVPRDGVPRAAGQAEDRITFYGHEALSAQMTRTIATRLKMSTHAADFVEKLVRWHLYPCQFGPASAPKSVQRYLRRMGDDAPDLTLLALADRLSTRGPAISEADIETSIVNHRWLMDQYEAQKAIFKLPRLLNGNQVMQALGIGPGPHVKQILDALEEAQHAGEITTEQEATIFLKSLC